MGNSYVNDNRPYKSIHCSNLSVHSHGNCIHGFATIHGDLFYGRGHDTCIATVYPDSSDLADKKYDFLYGCTPVKNRFGDIVDMRVTMKRLNTPRDYRLTFEVEGLDPNDEYTHIHFDRYDIDLFYV